MVVINEVGFGLDYSFFLVIFFLKRFSRHFNVDFFEGAMEGTYEQHILRFLHNKLNEPFLLTTSLSLNTVPALW